MQDSIAMPLAGRAALVTGASSGIGRAIATALARAGADVAITYHANADGGRETAAAIEALGRRAAVLTLDLADERRIRAIGGEARAALGRLDVWVNNAGADILTGPAASLPTVGRLDLLIAVDLRGTMLASWAAADLLGAQSDGGVIINMSWDHVVSGMPGTNPQLFAAVKGGVQAFSKSLARSLAPRVRVNVLAPGWIETAFGAELDDTRRSAIAESVPMQRWGTPDDVANAAVFLALPASAYLTGQTINVGGGQVM
jgi:3-oxoacyl-[acyl-carrier protein] reductase